VYCDDVVGVWCWVLTRLEGKGGEGRGGVCVCFDVGVEFGPSRCTAACAMANFDCPFRAAVGAWTTSLSRMGMEKWGGLECGCAVLFVRMLRLPVGLFVW
jgi:hypothetical protein